MKLSTLGFSLFLIILLVLNVFQYYQSSQLSEELDDLQERFPRPIAELKSPDSGALIGKNVTAEGYLAYIGNEIPVLLSSLMYLEIDASIPDEAYLKLRGNFSKELQAKTGGFLHITGTLLDLKGEITLDIVKQDQWKLVNTMESARYRWEVLAEPWAKDQISIIDPNKYAVLISGGGNSPHLRYWNDMKAMYSILTRRYGYGPDQVYVIYKDGVGEDIDLDVDYSATIANVETVFEELADILTEENELFIFTNNHGGGFNPDVPPFNWGGFIDDDGDEPEAGYSESIFGRDFNGDGDRTDFVRFDETLCMYSPISENLRDDDFADMLDSIVCGEMIIFMKQCFSGGFIHELSGLNRIILTACEEEEFAWGADTEGDFGEFSLHFMQVVNKENMGADVDFDKEISMVEAFNFASQQDSQDETPQYDDNSDRLGNEEPIPDGGDGNLGSNAFL
jgi:hypothetical protein